MLCHFFSGNAAEPVILIADKSLRADTIGKLRVPGLSPYDGASDVGHIWIANPKGGGSRTFFRRTSGDIAIPAFRANARNQDLLQLTFGKKVNAKHNRSSHQLLLLLQALHLPRSPCWFCIFEL
jgi:hypothetical protein